MLSPRRIRLAFGFSVTPQGAKPEELMERITRRLRFWNVPENLSYKKPPHREAYKYIKPKVRDLRVYEDIGKKILERLSLSKELN